MAKKRQNRLTSDTIEFGARLHTGFGIFSVCLIGLELLVLLYCIYLSYCTAGEGGVLMGVLGYLVILFAIGGIAFAILGLRKRGYSHRPEKVGLAGNSLVLLAMAAVILLGMSS